MENSFPGKYGYFIIILPISLLAFLLVKRGFIFTYDSYNFLCGALSFKEAGKILMCDNSPMTLSPPGFPVYLSCFLTKDKSVSGVYKIATLIVYGLTLLCWLRIINAELRHSRYLGFAVLLVVFALPSFYIHLFIWSEGIFLLFFSCAVLSLINFNKSLTLKWLLLASFSFCLSITMRYAGFILYLLFFIGWIYSQEAKLKRGEVFIMCFPVIVMGLLGVRNLCLDTVFFGERPFLNRNFIEVLNSCLKVICNWVVPADIIPGSFCVGILSLVLLLLAWFNRNIRLWLLPLEGYILFIAYSAYRTDIEYDERLFVPVYPILILCVFKSFSELPNTKRMNSVVLLFLILWVMYSHLRLVKNVLMWLNIA